MRVWLKDKRPIRIITIKLDNGRQRCFVNVLGTRSECTAFDYNFVLPAKVKESASSCIGHKNIPQGKE